MALSLSLPAFLDDLNRSYLTCCLHIDGVIVTPE